MTTGGGPLRILLDARKARDFGIGTYILGLLGGLAGRAELELTALVRAGDDGLLPGGVTPHRCEARNYSLDELVAVRRAISRLEPDVFHAPHYVVPFFPPAATVVTVHDLMHLQRPEHASPIRRLYATVMLHRAVRSAARLIAGSESTRADLVGFDGRAAEKTIVISYGLDPRFSTGIPEAERSRVRTRHGLATPYLLFLGNDKPHKNLHGLLDAFASHRRNGITPHQLALVGGASTRAAERRAAVEARGLSGVVHDLGFVPAEDVPPLLAEADALVLPSFAEGFGLPVLEAQAVGTPVVCSDRGGLREAAGDAALFIDPDRPATLAGALARLLTDEALRRELSARGITHAAGFSWPHVADRTAAVYRQALGAR